MKRCIFGVLLDVLINYIVDFFGDYFIMDLDEIIILDYVIQVIVNYIGFYGNVIFILDNYLNMSFSE